MLNGPIPAENLADLKFVQSYVGDGPVDCAYDVQLMLEYTCERGAPKWWGGTVAEFEKEFDDRYHSCQAQNSQLDLNFDRQAADAEVEARRLTPLPKNASRNQVKEFLRCGKRRRNQIFAVELLLDMWMETWNSD